MDPPKGMRMYPLKPDPAVMEASPLPLGKAKVTLLLRLSRAEHKNGSNLHWRLELVKASGLPAAAGDGACCNPYGEVYWRGRAEQEHQLTQLRSWELVGFTQTKTNARDPVFVRAEDHSMFELPPVWTERAVPLGDRPDSVREGGGWVARNHVPELPPSPEAQVVPSLSGKHMLSSEQVAASAAEDRRFRLAVKYQQLLAQEVAVHLEAARYLFKAAERERRCMGAEEELSRNCVLQREIERSRPLMHQQTAYSRSFMRLLRLVQEPPNILERLRFLMGEETLGGGMSVRCEDPATSKVFRVISTPLLYPEDEADMQAQLHALFSIDDCPQLTKIIDFSIHQIRDFTDRGFSGTDERVAIAVLQFVDGVSVLEYLLRGVSRASAAGGRTSTSSPAGKQQKQKQKQRQHQGAVGAAAINAAAVSAVAAVTAAEVQEAGTEVVPFAATPAAVAMASAQVGVTNDAFRGLLCQVANALRCMHRRGLLHRNLHPDAVVVRLPGSKQTLAPRRTQGSDAPKKVGGRRGSILGALGGPRPAGGDGGTEAVDPDEGRRKRRNTTAFRPLDEQVSVFVGDYWFLHNPRQTGCTFSQGRADWGAAISKPPEAKLDLAHSSSSPSSVCDRSDIYAFGMCVYYWATGGLEGLPQQGSTPTPTAPPIGEGNGGNADELASSAAGKERRRAQRLQRAHAAEIASVGGRVDWTALHAAVPLHWEKWLHSLLDMCLQPQPHLRASAEDVYLFLSSRHGKS